MIRFLVLLFLLVSCADQDQKKYFQLDELRVLALIADQPQINSAQSVSITPYLSYTNGGDSTLEITYKACLDPGINYGAKISCDGYSSSQILSGSYQYLMSNIGSANFYTGPITPLSLSIPNTAFIALAALDSKIQFNGIDYIVIFNIKDLNRPKNSVTAVKRISLTSKTESLNTNPTINGDILAANAPLNTFPSGKLNLKLESPSDPQTYQFKNEEGQKTLTEIMTVTWFVSSGKVNFSRSEADDSVKYDPYDNERGVFVAVYRDNRGGVVVKREVFP